MPDRVIRIDRILEGLLLAVSILMMVKAATTSPMFFRSSASSRKSPLPNNNGEKARLPYPRPKRGTISDGRPDAADMTADFAPFIPSSGRD